MKTYYIYKGPVKMFDDVIDHWEASTAAKSDRQALNNLTYRYKKEHKYLANTRITLNMDYLQKMYNIPDKSDYEYYDEDMQKMLKGGE